MSRRAASTARRLSRGHGANQLASRWHLQTHPIHVIDGREQVIGVRTELFTFGDVVDVFVTGRRDVLVVVSSGRPRPAEWLRALRAAGYEVRSRERSGATSGIYDAV